MSATPAPDSTAVRVALWRALHVEIDAPPHVFEDVIGMKLANPDGGWRSRPDMVYTARFRASIVARARFIEDLVEKESRHGVSQYVILGAGLDTFAQRRPDLASKLTIFEIDKPSSQDWKRERLIETGLGIPEYLKLVPVDFEAGTSWKDQLIAVGFDPKKPAVIVSTGVSMYLTPEAIVDTLQKVATLARGSTFVMTFLLPMELIDAEDQPGFQMAEKGARASGTPFISFFAPREMLQLARDAGFKEVEHTSTAALTERYFSARTDGFRPSTGEELLIATT